MGSVLQVQAFIASSRKVRLCLLVLYGSMLLLSSAYTSVSLPTSSSTSILLFGRRLLEKRSVLEESDDEVQHFKKLSVTPNALGTTTKNNNKTKVIKPTTTTTTTGGGYISANLKKNQTKPSKTVISNKNSTKTNKDSSFQEKPMLKTTNLTKTTAVLTRKSVDPTKKTKSEDTPLKKPTKSLGWASEDDDFVAGFIDLPSRLQETLLPDLEVLSITSKAYLDKANKEITNGFKPIVGKKYAPTVASMVSFVFILTPFLLVSLIFNQIKAYFSLQKLVIFIHFYLSIYFSILCLTSLVTGMEPLKFFYATSQSTYICIQLLQTLAYVLYLLVLLMYFVLVFSTETGMGTKLLGFGQMFVGFAVGFHYYTTVFHRAVLHQPPKTSWKFHAIYATCFLLICLLDRAERRKKAYVVDGSEEGKMS